MPRIFLELVQNISLLLALCMAYRFIYARLQQGTLAQKILTGFMFGLFCILGMLTPFNYGQGIIFDGRSIIISLAGFFGGLIPALITAIVASAYRLFLGGMGAKAGVGVIFASALIGVIYHYIRQKKPNIANPWHLYLFGVLVHLAMVLLMLTLPAPNNLKVFNAILFPVMLIYPIGTVLIAGLLSHEESSLQLQQSLKTSEAKYRELVENTNSIIIRWRPPGVITFFNEYAQRFFGYKEEEIIGKNVLGTIVPEKDTAGRDLEAMLSDILVNPERYAKNNNENMRRDGSRVWISWTNKPILDEKGKLLEILSVGNDITQVKEGELQLKESEQKYRSLFEQMIDGFSYHKMVLDENGKASDFLFIEVNNTFEKFTGIKKENVMGKTLREAMPMKESSYQQWISLYEKVAMEGQELRLKEIYSEDLGRWYSINAYSPQKEYFVTVFTDITKKKSTEANLQHRMKELNCLYEISKLLENPFVSIEELLQGIADRIPSAFQTPDATRVKILFREKEYRSKLCTGTCENCEVFFIQNELSAQGENNDYIKVCVDKTLTFLEEEKQLINVVVERINQFTRLLNTIEEREYIAKQLQQTQKLEAIGTMAGGIAHDFNNILGIILCQTQIMMEDTQKDSQTYWSLEQIYKASERATDLVKQILAFSRHSKHEMKPLRLTPLVKEAIKMLRSTIPTTIEIKIEANCTQDTVLGDSTQIHQILMNLCVNAEQVMHEKGGVLSIRLENEYIGEYTDSAFENISPGKYVKLIVSDTGTGIPKDNLSKIFDPFFTTKEVGKGTGLGLAVAYGIAKNHHGVIRVESEVGKGATFTVLLPVAEEKEKVEKKTEEEIPKGTEKILFVDDEKYAVETWKILLERLGYTVTVTQNSLEALEMFKNNPSYFDLVITDMTMPRMTGKTLAEELIKIRKDIPIILCSGYSDLITNEDMQRIGIKGYIMKPFNRADIAKTIRNILDKK